jgi:enoyl-CoA hydratase/carnithine racemase
MTDLVFEVEQGVATIRLNRPDKLNAFTFPMLEAWLEALKTSQERDDIRVVVLTGTGRGFCSGGDVSAMRERAAETAYQRKAQLYERILAIPRFLENFDKPYIAALNGVAAGAGLDMALMADIRFAAESARFAESYVKVGLVPGDGGSWYLPRLIGPARALELLWTGDFIDAETAERIGLVNKAVPDDRLMDHTYEFARRLAAGPSLAIRMMKRAVYQGMHMTLPASLDMVSSHLGVIATTADHREAVAAFAEKRPPIFTGT